MESLSDQERVTFRVLESRLLAFVNARIRNGEFSERGLAGALGVSQPQLHNVLKGQRKLQTTLADALLARFQISVLDLLSAAERARLQEKLSASLLGPETRRRLCILPPKPPVIRDASLLPNPNPWEIT